MSEQVLQSEDIYNHKVKLICREREGYASRNYTQVGSAGQIVTHNYILKESYLSQTTENPRNYWLKLIWRQSSKQNELLFQLLM